MSELDKETAMMLGEMRQSIKTTEENCKEIFRFLHEMRTNGLPICREQVKRVETLDSRVGRIEVGLVRMLIAMVGSGVTGGAAVSVFKSFLGA